MGLTNPDYWIYWLSHPLAWVFLAFQVWMLVDAFRRGEMFWALFILLFPLINAILYYFMVYRREASPVTVGFELPGAHDRKRIRELEAQIHHLDKAHHHSQLGDIYFQQGKLKQAEACYRAALERDAEDLDTRAHLGQCLLRQKRPQEAKPLLEGVCAEKPDHDYGHTLMALAETVTALGDTARALQLWEQVIAGHAYPRAKVQLAELYLSQGKRDEALAAVREVVDDDAHAPAFQRKRDKVWVRRAKSLLNKLK